MKIRFVLPLLAFAAIFVLAPAKDVKAMAFVHRMWYGHGIAYNGCCGNGCGGGCGASSCCQTSCCNPAPSCCEPSCCSAPSCCQPTCCVRPPSLCPEVLPSPVQALLPQDVALRQAVVLCAGLL